MTMNREKTENNYTNVDTGELLYTKRVLGRMSLKELLSLEAKDRNLKVLKFIEEKLSKVTFLKKLGDKRWRREFLKYLRLSEFDENRVIQLKEERAVGLFIILKGTVKEYRRIVPKKRKINLVDDGILANDEEIESKLDASLQMSPTRKNVLKKKISSYVKDNRLSLIKKRSRVKKSDSIFVLKSAMANSDNSILARIGQNRYSMDHIKSPLYNNQFKKTSKYFNIEYLNSRGIKFNSKDRFYRTVWELNKVLKKGESIGINDLLKTKKFSYTYAGGDSGVQLLFLPLENFSSLLENQLRAKNTQMKLLMEEDIFTGIHNKGLFDQLVYDFREFELKKDSFVYKKGDFSRFVYILLEGSVEIIEFISPKDDLADVFEVGKTLLHGVNDRTQEALKNLERKTIVYLKKNFKKSKKVTVYNVGLNQVFGEIECLQPPEDLSYAFEILNIDLDSSCSSSEGINRKKVAKNYKKYYARRNFSAIVTSRTAKLLRIPVETLRLRFNVFKELYTFIINRIEKKKQVYKKKLAKLACELKKESFIYERNGYKSQTYTAKRVSKKYRYYRDRIKSLNFKIDNEEKAIHTEEDLMQCLAHLKVSLRLSLQRQKLDRFKNYYQAVKEGTKRKIELRKRRLERERNNDGGGCANRRVMSQDGLSHPKGRRPKGFTKGNLYKEKPFTHKRHKRSMSLGGGHFSGLGGADFFKNKDENKRKFKRAGPSSVLHKRTATCSTELLSKGIYTKPNYRPKKEYSKNSSVVNFRTIIEKFEKNNFTLNSEFNLKPPADSKIAFFDEKDQITNFELNQRARKKLRGMLNFRRSGVKSGNGKNRRGKRQIFNTEF